MMAIESLETRAVPATFNITPTSDAGSLRATIAVAAGNADPSNTINLGSGTYQYSAPVNGNPTTAGEILISIPAGKSLTISGDGTRLATIDAASEARAFEVVGAGSVVFQKLTIQKGKAVDGGKLGGTAALGGGLLIEGANVALDQALLFSNEADAAQNPAFGARGFDAAGGGIYLASGGLSITNSRIGSNIAHGGLGGPGLPPNATGTKPGTAGDSGTRGQDGTAGTDAILGSEGSGTNGTNGDVGGDGNSATDVLKSPDPVGDGGDGGDGGDARGGGLYVASGVVTIDASVLPGNGATGGSGNNGGGSSFFEDQPLAPAGGSGGTGG